MGKREIYLERWERERYIWKGEGGENGKEGNCGREREIQNEGMIEGEKKKTREKSGTKAD